MPQFEKLDPKSIVLGRGVQGVRRREPYRQAIKSSTAGRVVLQPDDEPNRVKRDLQVAASEVGIKVRSSWEDEDHSALIWKRSAT